MAGLSVHRLMRVLDTAALLAWPLEAIRGQLSPASLFDELSRHGPDRAILLEHDGPLWVQVEETMRALARDAAKKSGDLHGLSPEDVDALGLALAKGFELVTDDYRLQNICAHLNHPCSGVLQQGIQAAWTWRVECRGCRREVAFEAEVPSKAELAEMRCDDCGSPLRSKRVRA